MFEIVDSVGMRFSILNAVCLGTIYDQAWIVREFESLRSPKPIEKLICLNRCLYLATQNPRKNV